MRIFARSAAALMLLCGLGMAQAATLTVTTNSDEANCNCNGAGCSLNPVCVHTSGSYPASTGCSLREALQNISDKAGNPAKTLGQMSFPECGLPDAGTGTSNTIVIGAHAINIYGNVPDPSDSSGSTTKSNTQLPFLQAETSAGSYALTGGSISCSYNPNSNPIVGGNSMFTTNNGAQVSFQGTSFHDCTAPADGVAIVNLGNSTGTLTLTGVTFTNIRATNQGNGGCIETGGGNLLITGGSFTTCVVDDGGVVPGGGAGNGGALYIGSAGGSSKVAISGVTFQANVAGSNGGAIYLAGTDAIAIDTSTFQANVAGGNTFSSGNGELGGGAIFASNTANGGNDGNTPGINASAFLIFQTNFTANTALLGTGGAILLTGGGKLTQGTLTVNLGDYTIGKAGIPGGIVASNFSANVAGGSWDTVNNGNLDPRAGAGGAVFANGYLSVFSSSFVGANSSTNASGGAIAFYDSGDSYDPLKVSNTTINGNSAGLNGGGIAVIPSKFTSNAGKLTLINDTIAGNSATGAGGGIHDVNTTAAEAQISNTILANNTGTAGNENCGGQAVTNVVGNLQFNPSTSCGAMPVGDPQLQAASVFGGVNALVFVMKLSDTSAANGIGDPATCTAAPIYNLDEALNSRPQGKPNCDSGAYEAASLTPVTLQSFDVE